MGQRIGCLRWHNGFKRNTLSNSPSRVEIMEMPVTFTELDSEERDFQRTEDDTPHQTSKYLLEAGDCVNPFDHRDYPVGDARNAETGSLEEGDDAWSSDDASTCSDTNEVTSKEREQHTVIAQVHRPNDDNKCTNTQTNKKVIPKLQQLCKNTINYFSSNYSQTTSSLRSKMDQNLSKCSEIKENRMIQGTPQEIALPTQEKNASDINLGLRRRKNNSTEDEASESDYSEEESSYEEESSEEDLSSDDENPLDDDESKLVCKESRQESFSPPPIEGVLNEAFVQNTSSISCRSTGSSSAEQVSSTVSGSAEQV